jgi:5-methyltetrahydrofolate--homocysteine methyltransferase
LADIKKLYNAILTGDQKTAIAVTEEALAENTNPQTLINDAMIPAMNEAGNRFECEDFFVPELLLAARAMKGSLKLIQPLLSAAGAKPIGTVVIGTVKGDLHDIGKNLVSSMLEGAGFKVVDLGADVPADKFVASIETDKPDILCMSALLTVTMPSMKSTIEALNKAGVRDRVKVLIGGAPVTSEYAAEIGADGFADNASTAVAKARELVA